MNDYLRNSLGCLVWVFWIVIVLGVWEGCNHCMSYKERQKIEEKRKSDSIKKAFVEDSLKHDTHYQDSIRKKEEEDSVWCEEEKKIKESELIGFVLGYDSVYHTCIHDIYYRNKHNYGFLVKDTHYLRFITRLEAEKLKMCTDCEEKEDVYYRYEEGDLFDEYTAKDHDYISIDDADEYCSHNKADEEEW